MNYVVFFLLHLRLRAFAIACEDGLQVLTKISANRLIYGVLLNTGMFVNSDSSLVCKGELEHIPDIASGIKLNFSFKVRSPPIAPKASLAQKINL